MTNISRDDRRLKRSHPLIKYAINRDGDLFFVECPICHRQDCLEPEDSRVRGVFRCQFRDCKHLFEVYTEDGVKTIFDHREGNLESKDILVLDGDKLRAGINDDAPWWWRRYPIYRDLQENGRDAHGHRPYYSVSRVIS